MVADHFDNLEEFEADLWQAADNLRANSNLASNEYFLPILGLIFLRHATNRYYAAVEAIEADKAAGKMPDRPLVEADFTRRRALMLPEAARYDVLLEMPKDGNLGAAVNAAMEAVEDHFQPLAGQLPKDYERFEDDVLEEMMRKFDSEALRTASALQDIREIVEQKLAQMLARNPARMDYQQKYEEIVADYNREKDRVTIEETFRRLMALMEELDAEQRRAVEEGLSEDELALFDLLKKDELGKAELERVKQASRDLLAAIKACLAELDRFWEKEQTKADVEVFILDEVYASLPTPPFTAEEKNAVAAEVYAHVWQQAVSGEFARAA